MENCDLMARLEQLRDTTKEKLYGKNILENEYIKRLCWKNKDGEYEFDTAKIERLYALFRYNIDTLVKHDIFEMKMLKVTDLITATAKKIWDWNSEEEKMECVQSILDCGVYFPIFVLPKGIAHNQVGISGDIDAKIIKDVGLYNSYNGNHRIDALQYINKNHKARQNNKTLKTNVLIIPPYCEKCCTGFNYTPLDYCLELPSIATEHTLDNLIGDVKLFHIITCNKDMKMYNIPTHTRDVYPDIDYVYAIDYQMCFRILQEFQNVLEVPLTMYYRRYGKLPDGIDTSWCNPHLQGEHFNKCPYKSPVDTCFILGTERNCSLLICCEACHKDDCKGRCNHCKE